MARKATKTTETVKTQVANPVAQAAVTDQKLIVAARKFDRWYVYFKGVAPKDNVGCGCKTAKSALRYMFMLKAKHGAAISQNMLDRLQFAAAQGL